MFFALEKRDYKISLQLLAFSERTSTVIVVVVILLLNIKSECNDGASISVRQQQGVSVLQ